MIAYQNQVPPLEGDVADRDMAEMRLGAEILRVAITYDDLLRRLESKTEALHRLAQKHKGLDQRIMQALLEVESNAEEEKQSCTIAELSASMILAEDIRTSTGVLMAPKGHEITLPLILKLKNMLAIDGIQNSASIVLTKPAAVAASTAS